MAVIGSIRKRSGLLLIFIGLALAAFVLGDFLKGGGNEVKEFGEIAGEKISYREFEAKVTERIENIKKQNQMDNVSLAYKHRIQQDLWDETVKDIIMAQELEKLGLTVTSEELFDMVQGKDPHPIIVRSFTDPNTGQFNQASVINFLQNLDQLDYERRQQWLNIEQMIKKDKINTKYNNLINKSFYVPKAFAEREHQKRNRKLKMELLTVKYNQVPDEDITVEESDLKNYYNKNIHNYEQEEAREIEFIIFDVQPSARDYAKAEKKINEVRKEMEEAEDIANLVDYYSDEAYDSSYYNEGSLPIKMDSFMFNSEIGAIVGPYIENQTYFIGKLVGKANRPDSIKLSQILIKYKGSHGADVNVTRSDEDAKAFADSLMNVLEKTPSKFEEFALNISEYPTVKEDKGDLGWAIDGDPQFGLFFEACIDSKPGDFQVKLSGLGYHIVLTTEKTKMRDKVRVATIKSSINASTETSRDIYSEASTFAAENRTYESFTLAAEEKGYNKRTDNDVKVMDNDIPGFEYSRSIVRWAYNEETNKGDVSDVLDLDGKYVIAALKEIKEKGNTPFELVKNEVKTEVQKEKKAEIIIEKINGLISSGKNINEIATAYNTQVDSLDYITFSSYSLPGAGPEPEVLGNLFTLEKGQVSSPIKGNIGVFIGKINDFVAPATQSHTSTIQGMKRFFESRTNHEVAKELKENTTIVDNRRWFY